VSEYSGNGSLGGGTRLMHVTFVLIQSCINALPEMLLFKASEWWATLDTCRCSGMPC